MPNIRISGASTTGCGKGQAVSPAPGLPGNQFAGGLPTAGSPPAGLPTADACRYRALSPILGVVAMREVWRVIQGVTSSTGIGRAMA